MAESTQAAHRQMQLEKQRILLDQKRKSRQLQSGKVTVNQLGGSRPSSSKHSRPNSTRPSSRISTQSRPSISKSTDTVAKPLTVTAETPPLSPTEVDNNSNNDDDYNSNNIDDGVSLPSELMVNKSISETEEEEVITSQIEEMDSFVDVSRKLQEMGISPTMGYDSDESQNTDGEDTDANSSIQHETGALITPTINPPIDEERPTSTRDATNKVYNPLNATVQDRMIKNLEEVVFRAPPEGVTIKCRITRDKQGVDRYMYPTYYLHLEWDDHTKFFLLAARKKKRARSLYYVITVDPVAMTRESAGFVAKLRSNFVGTSFVVYDDGHKPLSSSPTHATVTSKGLREELAAVNYETNILGFKGPRRMNVIIPCMAKDVSRMKVQPTNNSETLLERLRTKQLSNLLLLYNKQPVWSPETQAYVLNFHGRVTEASVKNFQLVHASEEDYVIMQFGKISEDVFTMDYCFPVSAVQAFAIALSSFDSKLACE